MDRSRQHPPPTADRVLDAPPEQLSKPFNIAAIDSLLADDPCLRYPEVRAAVSALRCTHLREPPLSQWHDTMDLLDWLGLFFGFQNDNVRNQREHLVLHLANSQMRRRPPPAVPDRLDPVVLRRFRVKLLKNYSSWCSYLGKRSQVRKPNRLDPDFQRRELLYVCLYLLIWGEAANLRFLPECLCYVYHHMALELNYILDDHFDRDTRELFVPSTCREFGFLDCVVTPIYATIKGEAAKCRNGTAPYSAWRNYDDINEYFWSRRCFKSAKWPFDLSSSFFLTAGARRVGKTGFVEHRTLWNVFRSFHRLWVLLILFFQAAAIAAWAGREYPWQAWESRDVRVELLTIFITWSALRFVQSILDAVTQYNLVRRDTMLLCIRMILKILVALAWGIAFVGLYRRIWSQKSYDGGWSYEANQRILTFLKAALIFVIPELLALTMFILPWIHHFIEEADWPVLYVLRWWFHTPTFVGRGVSQGLVDNIKYSLFWVAVLASKFSFSYLFQIKPLVGPTRILLNTKGVTFWWDEFCTSNRMAVAVLWAPVFLIYLVDLQIWYAVFASLWGSTIGLFSHIGEIQNIGQLRTIFLFFASALQFNLMPEDNLFSFHTNVVDILRDAIHRLMVRYGLVLSYKKIFSSQVEAARFALIWNEIIITFREEDLISDQELEQLELPPNCWDIRVIRWPCVLLCNELLLALNQAKELKDEPDSDRWLWSRVCKNEYRQCAVTEAYDSIRYLLLKIIKHGTVEHSIATRFFLELDQMIVIEKFTVAYKTTVLPKIHKQSISLVKLLLVPEKNIDRVVNIIQALYELAVRELPRVKKTVAQLRQEGLAPLNPNTEAGLLFENAVQLPDADDTFFYKQLRRLLTILTFQDSMHNAPRNLEARRRIVLFSNSLFMNMPRAPQVEKMMAFSVLIPYYDEEVLYGKENLRSLNEDGISTLFYLQKIYEDEWENFMERMRREGLRDDCEIWTTKTRDLRLWASYRGQTLSRTVRGMMYYCRALTMLSYLDFASEMDIRQGLRDISLAPGSLRNNRCMNIQGLESSANLPFISHVPLLKFTYVVACQMYGVHKRKSDPRAQEILHLMKNNTALRVAYVDEVCSGREEEEVEYYSVLVKYDQQQKKEVEIYRIKLPGPPKLGEDKSENLNHAVIFTRGDAVQTVDTSQVIYFEEALKMRNLLEEFKLNYGIRKHVVLGLRQNIFTSSVSSMAWLMSQEMSSVTLGQRVLANPLKIGMPNGHSNVFDRFWFLTRGGLCKDSRARINFSEDIYAGLSCMLRGGYVTHHEYIQVGKEREGGLNQISMMEAKVASANGQQVSSRDIYRLGQRLDFFRMLSLFYTTVGFYFNAMMVVIVVYTFLLGRLYLALSGVEGHAKFPHNNKAIGVVISQQFIIQIGVCMALPMILENSLEHGFIAGAWDFIMMQLQFGSFFHAFSMGTRSHFFARTILHGDGGAMYHGTARAGLIAQHTRFTENYRLYARSHFVKSIELGGVLLVYASASQSEKDTFVYIALTASSWFLVLSWMMAPFIFNPSSFEWRKTVHDFDEFMKWIRCRGVMVKADESWETWWHQEQKDHFRSSDLWGKLVEMVLDLRFFLFQYGIVYHLNVGGWKVSIYVYVIVGVGVYLAVACGAKGHVYYRLIEFIVVGVMMVAFGLLVHLSNVSVTYLVMSLVGFLSSGWGVILIAEVLRPLLVGCGVVWESVVALARLYDMMFGLIVMAPLALLSWIRSFCMPIT
ncbi:glucan synthase-like 1 [Perilla frutescens var. frutescens]|nr:glucan synthase-like 1 [Perilla frutescens var. frutescens]